MTAARHWLPAVLAALGMAVPVIAQPRCQATSVELPVRMVGSRAVATLEINGTTVPLTVDSGAFFSMLTEAAASQLQLRLNGNASVRRLHSSRSGPTSSSR